MNQIFRDTPYFLFTGNKGEIPMKFMLRNSREEADYFNYLMFLKDKYESEEAEKDAVKVLKLVKELVELTEEDDLTYFGGF